MKHLHDSSTTVHGPLVESSMPAMPTYSGSNSLGYLEAAVEDWKNLHEHIKKIVKLTAAYKTIAFVHIIEKICQELCIPFDKGAKMDKPVRTVHGVEVCVDEIVGLFGRAPGTFRNHRTYYFQAAVVHKFLVSSHKTIKAADTIVSARIAALVTTNLDSTNVESTYESLSELLQDVHMLQQRYHIPMQKGKKSKVLKKSKHTTSQGETESE